MSGGHHPRIDLTTDAGRAIVELAKDLWGIEEGRSDGRRPACDVAETVDNWLLTTVGIDPEGDPRTL